MIVGLVGFIGSGKGTVGDILSEKGFVRLSFASSLKDIAADMFGWERSLLEGDTDVSRHFREQPDAFWSKEFGKEFTPRLALQLLGTEVGRNVFHPDFWVIKTKQYMHMMMSKGYENFVITDVRFPNEMKMLQNEGGITIEVRRGVTPHWYDIAGKANRGDNKAEEFMRKEGIHESEWRWIGSEIDYIINNDGTKNDLEKNVIKCLTNYYGSSMIKEYIEGVL